MPDPDLYHEFNYQTREDMPCCATCRHYSWCGEATCELMHEVRKERMGALFTYHEFFVQDEAICDRYEARGTDNDSH